MQTPLFDLGMSQRSVQKVMPYLTRGNYLSDDEVVTWVNVVALMFHPKAASAKEAVRDGYVTLCQMLGTDAESYKKMRSKMRKLGLYKYNAAAREWSIVRPKVWMEELEQEAAASQPVIVHALKRFFG